jgi:hypothetical protein
MGIGGSMKRLLLAAPVLFLLLSTNALADTITLVLAPNFDGDNFGFIEQGNGFKYEVSGGTPTGFLSAETGIAPGSTIGGSVGIDVFFGSGFATIHGVTSDLNFFNGPGTLFIGGFTLPTNGKDFAIKTTASFSVVGTLPDGQTINIGGSAPGKMKFRFSPSDGVYYADVTIFTTAPEPATVGLLATGIIGILTSAKRSWRHSLNRRPRS